MAGLRYPTRFGASFGFGPESAGDNGAKWADRVNAPKTAWESQDYRRPDYGFAGFECRA